METSNGRQEDRTFLDLIQNMNRWSTVFLQMHFVDRSCTPLTFKLGIEVKVKLSHHKSLLYQLRVCSYHFPSSRVMFEE